MSGKFLLGTVIVTIIAGCSTAPTDTPPETTPDFASTYADKDWTWNEQVTFSEDCEKWDDWNKPADPFRIFGNTYYVGTCGISAILILGEDGHALIDTGTAEGARIVLRNISRTGANPKDIKLLLHSHEHFDHVGGMAFIEKATGAKVVASPNAALVLITGDLLPADPQYGMHKQMRSVRKVDIIDTGEKFTLNDGEFEIKPIATPGHSPGALSWTWRTCEGELCRTIVYADSLSPVSRDGYKFSDHPEYVAEYRAGLKRLATLDCDILLTPHPSASKMLEKIAADSLVTGMDCAEYAASVERRLNERLAKEASDK